jgi:malate dehydrogenase (oxaloacetate-decarboxylating)
MPEAIPNWQERYNARMVLTVRVRVLDTPGGLAQVLDALARVAVSIGDISIVGVDSTHKIRDLQLFIMDHGHLDAATAALEAIPELDILQVTDDVLEVHRGGPIETRPRVRLKTLTDLRMVYTPGVAAVCELIARDPEQAWTFTGRGGRVAIVTNGTAVLGLGNIGPLAGLPVMEGKSAILAEFVGVSADAMLIDSRDPDEIVQIVERTAMNYGAIQLEDIAAPDCFDIEQRLQERLDIPVFHDDQHGTATVVVAGLINALRRTARAPGTCRAVILGAGAAGSAIARFLVDFGIPDVVVCDSAGAIHRGRSERMNPWKERLAEVTNPDDARGGLADVMRGRNLFIGVSRPNVVTGEMVASMAEDPIVFALANPVSEIPLVDALEAGAAVAIDGRSMNNALAYPGIFRGALDARAPRITRAMMIAAAESLAASAIDGLLPSMLDHDVHHRVAHAVAAAAAVSLATAPLPE